MFDWNVDSYSGKYIEREFYENNVGTNENFRIVRNKIEAVRTF